MWPFLKWAPFASTLKVQAICTKKPMNFKTKLAVTLAVLGLGLSSHALQDPPAASPCGTCEPSAHSNTPGSNSSDTWGIYTGPATPGDCLQEVGEDCIGEGCQFNWHMYSSVVGLYDWHSASVNNPSNPQDLARPPSRPVTGAPWTTDSTDSVINATFIGSDYYPSVACGTTMFIKAAPAGETSMATVGLRCNSCYVQPE